MALICAWAMCGWQARRTGWMEFEVKWLSGSLGGVGGQVFCFGIWYSEGSRGRGFATSQVRVFEVCVHACVVPVRDNACDAHRPSVDSYWTCDSQENNCSLRKLKLATIATVGDCRVLRGAVNRSPALCDRRFRGVWDASITTSSSLRIRIGFP